MKTGLLIIIGIVTVFVSISVISLKIFEDARTGYNNTQEQLEKILSSCKYQEHFVEGQTKDGKEILFAGNKLIPYSNGTHYIDNDMCEWRKIK